MVGFEPVTWLSTVRWFDHWTMTTLIQVLDVFLNLFERIDYKFKKSVCFRASGRLVWSDSDRPVFYLFWPGLFAASEFGRKKQVPFDIWQAR